MTSALPPSAAQVVLRSGAIFSSYSRWRAWISSLCRIVQQSADPEFFLAHVDMGIAEETAGPSTCGNGSAGTVRSRPS